MVVEGPEIPVGLQTVFVWFEVILLQLRVGCYQNKAKEGFYCWVRNLGFGAYCSGLLLDSCTAGASVECLEDLHTGIPPSQLLLSNT